MEMQNKAGPKQVGGSIRRRIMPRSGNIICQPTILLSATFIMRVNVGKLTAFRIVRTIVIEKDASP